jgi:staphylococcal nuclease domain-containing protein 1
LNSFSEYTAKLDAAQQNAKVQKKGRWGDGASGHVRDITLVNIFKWTLKLFRWTVDNIRHLVDSLKQRPQKAIIEHVRDGSTVRAFLIPSFQYVTVMMSGVKVGIFVYLSQLVFLQCPIYRMGTGGEVIESEPFAEEAKYFTESRLLQREVDIILESVSNQNLIGSILHPVRQDLCTNLICHVYRMVISPNCYCVRDWPSASTGRSH